MKKPLIILSGPTAAGKTKTSIELAKRIGGEIISADSMQVYRHMDIGTAKVTAEEMQGIKHYLIDEFEPDEEFNIVKFKEYADRYINEIISKGCIPIMAGGTGFYIQAVLNDISFEENESDDSYRKELEAVAKEKGAQYLHDMLAQVDEKSAQAIHANNVKRVIRALEFYKMTGLKMSEHNETERQKTSPYNYLYIVLTDDRDKIYERIDTRVDRMLEDGLVEEVQALKEAGYTKELVSMQGLGYKEILDYLDGNITLEEAVYILKRDTRHFAKRQLTWFKRERDTLWINISEYNSDVDAIIEKIVSELKERNIIA